MSHSIIQTKDDLRELVADLGGWDFINDRYGDLEELYFNNTGEVPTRSQVLYELYQGDIKHNLNKTFLISDEDAMEVIEDIY